MSRRWQDHERLDRERPAPQQNDPRGQDRGPQALQGRRPRGALRTGVRYPGRRLPGFPTGRRHRVLPGQASVETTGRPIRDVRLALIGFGHVGRAFARLLLLKQYLLRERYGLNPVVTTVLTG